MSKFRKKKVFSGREILAKPLRGNKQIFKVGLIHATLIYNFSFLYKTVPSYLFYKYLYGFIIIGCLLSVILVYIYKWKFFPYFFFLFCYRCGYIFGVSYSKTSVLLKIDSLTVFLSNSLSPWVFFVQILSVALFILFSTVCNC